MKMKGNKLTRLYYKSLRSIKHNAPTILSIVAGVGVVATGYLAAKEASKAQVRLAEAAKEKGEPLTKIEIAVNAAPAYIPAIGVGTATIMCIFGANVLNKKQQECLVAAYNSLAQYHRNYRDALIKLHGEEADKEVITEMARAHCDYHITDLDCPDDKVIFYDSITGESIVAYERTIMDAEYHLNRNFSFGGTVTVNDWRAMLGLEWVPEGDSIGWYWGMGINWIDFEHIPIDVDTAGTPLYCISATFGPDILDDYM